jgi:pyrophosphatase PpaX
LTDLARRGTRLGIVTSKPHGLARHGLELCGLDQHFEVLIGSDDVQRHKPDPAPVHAALAALGTPVEGALFVGDSPYDLQSGRRAGVHTGAALWGPFPLDLLREDDPTHELTTLPQVAQVRP